MAEFTLFQDGKTLILSNFFEEEDYTSLCWLAADEARGRYRIVNADEAPVPEDGETVTKFPVPMLTCSITWSIVTQESAEQGTMRMSAGSWKMVRSAHPARNGLMTA